MRFVAAALLWVALVWAPAASAAPYVSCPGGYIAPTLKDCPPWPPRNMPGQTSSGSGGSGGGGGGLLGDLLGAIGLGGLL